MSVIKLSGQYKSDKNEGKYYMNENLAKATLRIECGSKKGSGFHFRKKEIIVTNHHVIEFHLTKGTPIFAITENGDIFELELLDYSPKTENDYAILKTKSEINLDRIVLQPKNIDTFNRGINILFSGFPHGIPHLLVQKAIISGNINNKAFYIDGSINGGNSGGPIIDISDGKIIGIVTQRRFLGGAELDKLDKRAIELRKHYQQIAGRGSVKIMGIDFGEFANLMAESLLLIDAVLKANANTGIGIGFKIKFVNDAYNKLGLY